jgi:prepilin-type N-terminal cleavage/methylation domain-containing protein
MRLDIARTLDTRRRGTARRDFGLTMIEIVVAMSVFALLSLASTSIILRGLHFEQQGASRTYAASLAASEMDALRAKDPASIVEGTSTHQDPTNKYTVQDTAAWVSLGTAGFTCANGSGYSNIYMRLDISVWSTSGGPLPKSNAVQLTTLLAPTQNSSSNASGNIAVQISKADGSPAAGIPVTITDLSGHSLTPVSTGTDGCAYFPGLLVGSVWVVSANQSGYVTTTPNATTFQQGVTIGAGATSYVSFSYDQAETLAVQLPPGVTTPDGMPFSLYSPILSSTRYLSPLSAYAALQVFPDPAGYQIWFGACQDADPTYSLRPGGTSAARVTYPATPGGADAAVLQGVEVDFSSITAGTLTVSHAAIVGDLQCSSPVSYTLTGASLSTRLFLPYGTWTLTDASGTARTIVLDPSEPQINLNMATGAIT